MLPYIAVDPSKASSLHLWGGGKILYQKLFVSRALKEAWEAVGCGPVAFIPCHNV